MSGLLVLIAAIFSIWVILAIWKFVTITVPFMFIIGLGAVAITAAALRSKGK
jgi:hypothetical protein